jgi:hypothetical protein
MFSQVFQGGSNGVEIFSPSGTDPYKIMLLFNESAITKTYDRNIKGYYVAMEQESTVTKVQCPKKHNTSLGITQPVLCFQLQFIDNKNFSIECAILDDQNQRRRLHFSTNFRELDSNALHVRIPWSKDYSGFEGKWVTVCINLEDICRRSFKNVAYRTLESFIIHPACRIRKIFSLPAQSLETAPLVTIPTSFDFPIGVPNMVYIFDPFTAPDSSRSVVSGRSNASTASNAPTKKGEPSLMLTGTATGTSKPPASTATTATTTGTKPKAATNTETTTTPAPEKPSKSLLGIKIPKLFGKATADTKAQKLSKRYDERSDEDGEEKQPSSARSTSSNHSKGSVGSNQQAPNSARSAKDARTSPVLIPTTNTNNDATKPPPNPTPHSARSNGVAAVEEESEEEPSPVYNKEVPTMIQNSATSHKTPNFQETIRLQDYQEQLPNTFPSSSSAANEHPQSVLIKESEKSTNIHESLAQTVPFHHQDKLRYTLDEDGSTEQQKQAKLKQQSELHFSSASSMMSDEEASALFQSHPIDQGKSKTAGHAEEEEDTATSLPSLHKAQHHSFEQRIGESINGTHHVEEDEEEEDLDHALLSSLPSFRHQSRSFEERFGESVNRTHHVEEDDEEEGNVVRMDDVHMEEIATEIGEWHDELTEILSASKNFDEDEKVRMNYEIDQLMQGLAILETKFLTDYGIGDYLQDVGRLSAFRAQAQ